ncbi:Uma2 family endonuclease [Nostoc sp. FACHB-152]|uniref:Uma2 family endonuclease n=1 Tax=unclassified Nostoc TaxID=2593658 RepID=UPI001689D45C|nr:MULTISPECIES: Uma2 family endonuclease [unclassified Nostoc]MBD2446136.1 Uma2 family endonuclease [Nostoc sp. FACHB-152]MBD2467368.1 Uma2 family endonuclease [Nostoc sp. FACHB-145]
MTQTNVRLWNVDEYHRMLATGIITADERVELIEGQVIPMSAKNPPHAATTLCASDYLKRLLAEVALVRVQDPIQLSQYSEPEPDIAVVRINSRKYVDHHPAPDEVFLLIEVADTTLESDHQQKAPLYAQAGIIEYWILDVNQRQVDVFREPNFADYNQQLILDEDVSINLVAFPEIAVQVSQLFP